MLSTIPREILLLITGHLSSYKDSVSLASCCHQFHALLKPHIFTTLEPKRWDLRHLSRLTHSIARNPKLAKAVRVLRLDDGPCSLRPDGLYDLDTIQPLLEAATSSSKELTKWTEKLTAGSGADPWIAILLPLLPNLEKLVMTVHYESVYTRTMMQRVTRNAVDTTFSRLREVTLSWWNTEGGLPSSYILPFFWLPSLRIFRGEILQDGCRGDEDMHYDDPDYEEEWKEEEDDDGDDIEAKARYPAPQDFSDVTHLHLHHSNSERGFPDLIGASRRLKSFVYEHSEEYGRGNYFNPRAFYKSLYKHKESLEEIALCEDMWSQSSDGRFVGSFSDFVALKKLRISSQNILDWRDQDGTRARNTLSDVLPVCLESLVIEAFDECDSIGLTAHLESLVRRVEARTHCANLRVLQIKGEMSTRDPTIDYNSGWPPLVPTIAPEYSEMTANLAALCRTAGIWFRLWNPYLCTDTGKEG